MPDLKRCLEIAGYTKVKTILSSGNVAFDSASGSLAAIQLVMGFFDFAPNLINAGVQEAKQ